MVFALQVQNGVNWGFCLKTGYVLLCVVNHNDYIADTYCGLTVIRIQQGELRNFLVATTQYAALYGSYRAVYTTVYSGATVPLNIPLLRGFVVHSNDVKYLFFAGHWNRFPGNPCEQSRPGLIRLSAARLPWFLGYSPVLPSGLEKKGKHSILFSARIDVLSQNLFTLKLKKSFLLTFYRKTYEWGSENW